MALAELVEALTINPSLLENEEVRTMHSILSPADCMFRELVQSYTDAAELLEFAHINNLSDDADVIRRLNELYAVQKVQLYSDMINIKTVREFEEWSLENAVCHESVVAERLKLLKLTDKTQICQYCQKRLKTKFSLKRHLKICRVRKIREKTAGSSC